MLFFIGMFIVVVGSVTLAYYLSKNKKLKDNSQTKLVNNHTKTYRKYRAYHWTDPAPRSNNNNSDFGTSFVVASVTDDSPSWSGNGGTFSGAGGSGSYDSGSDCSSSSSYDSGSSCDSGSSSFGGSD